MKWMILVAAIIFMAIAASRHSGAIAADDLPSGLSIQVMKVDPAYSTSGPAAIPSSWRCVGAGQIGGVHTLWFQDSHGSCYGIQVVYDNGSFYLRSPNVAKLEAR